MASLLFSCRDLPAANQSAVVGAAADDPSSVDSIATAAAVADPAETTTTDVAGLCPDDSVTDAVWFYLPPSASVFVLFCLFCRTSFWGEKEGAATFNHFFTTSSHSPRPSATSPGLPFTNASLDIAG